MTQIIGQCSQCKNWQGTNKCPAYNAGIPYEVLFNDVLHDRPTASQTDDAILFTPKDQKAAVWFGRMKEEQAVAE